MSDESDDEKDPNAFNISHLSLLVGELLAEVDD